MKDVEQLAIQTYELNMKYIKEQQPKLYNLMQEFELAIQNNQYIQKYDLEYTNGGFDIKDIASGEYMYSQNSSNFIQESPNQINFQKNQSSISTFSILDYTKENMTEYQVHARKYIYLLMQYVLSNKVENATMLEVIKFIFYGVGLGLHIEPIHEKLKAHNYFIIEDNIEIFKLSLFTTKYYKIANEATLFFSVYENSLTFENSYHSYLLDGYIYNYLLKFIHFLPHSKTKLKHLLALSGALNFHKFSYQLELNALVSPIKCMQKNYSLTNVYKKPSKNIFDEKPVIVLAAGPSLGKNLEWLQMYQDRFIIIAVSTVLKKLDKNNITPDIVVSLDAEELVKDYFIDFQNNHYLDNTSVIYSSVTHKNILELTYIKNKFILDSSYEFNSEDKLFEFSCVGSFAYLYALNLDVKSIYILGLDLAVDQETGADHLDDYNREVRKLKIDEDDDNILDNLDIEGIPIKIVGNLKDEVYTTATFNVSVNTIQRYAPVLKKEFQNVYNLSSGAKIAEAEAMRIEEIDIENFLQFNKKDFFNSFKKFLEQNTRQELNQKELELLSNYKNIVKKARKIISKYMKKEPSSEYSVYKKKLIKLEKDIMDISLETGNNVLKIYQRYFEYALNIIYDFFNTKELENRSSHIKEIDKIFVDGLEDITKQFEDTFR